MKMNKIMLLGLTLFFVACSMPSVDETEDYGITTIEHEDDNTDESDEPEEEKEEDSLIVQIKNSEFVDYEDDLIIVSNSESAKIYYTIDGTEPSAKSTQYTKPIKVTTNITVKTIAIDSDKTSEIVSKDIKIKMYSVSYVTDNEEPMPETLYFHKGEIVTLSGAIEPIYEGHWFRGWTLNGEDCVETEYTVTSDIAFEAKWELWPRPYTPREKIPADYSVADIITDYENNIRYATLIGTNGVVIRIEFGKYTLYTSKYDGKKYLKFNGKAYSEQNDGIDGQDFDYWLENSELYFTSGYLGESFTVSCYANANIGIEKLYYKASDIKNKRWY